MNNIIFENKPIHINSRTKLLLFSIVLVAGFFLVWFFRSVFFFILISAVLSLINRPLVDMFKRIKVGKLSIGNSWAALFAVLVIWAVIVLIFWFTIPLVMSELQFLSTVDIPSVIDRVGQMLFLAMEPFRENNSGLVDMIEKQIEQTAISLFDFGQISDVFYSMFDFLGGLFIASFSISFITFFFLKEEGLLVSGILLFIPERYESGLKNVMQSIRSLLRRYFVGVLIQTILIAILVTVGFSLIGVSFNHAAIIGIISGLLNIIPYVGPLIGAFFGLLVGIIIYLQTSLDMVFLNFLFWIGIIYCIVQLIDNIVFQPVIFSNSVKAHPLEIFIVILAAGYMSGILGMFLAIPVYTIIRVVAHEFFFSYRLVQKLTGQLKID